MRAQVGGERWRPSWPRGACMKRGRKWQPRPKSQQSQSGRPIRWKQAACSLSLILVVLAAGLMAHAASEPRDRSKTIVGAAQSTESPADARLHPETRQRVESEKVTTAAAATTTTTTTSETSTTAPNKSDRNDENSASTPGQKCSYDKGQWSKCDSNGSQQRVMRLKSGDRNQCKPSKTIRRDCKNGGDFGCKYARGEWSSLCQGGKRTRVDRLVGLVDGDGNLRQAAGAKSNQNKETSAAAELGGCKAERRVTKDCGRTCHYVKSAWSECSSEGFRTRVLTLNETGDEFGREPVRTLSMLTTSALGTASEVDPAKDATDGGGGGEGKHRQRQLDRLAAGDNQICARQKLIRRECRAKAGANSAIGQQQQQQQQQRQPQTSSSQVSGSNGSGGAQNMRQIQRRRLKQIKLRQQPARATAAAASKFTGPQAATTAAATTTTTTTTTTAAAAVKLQQRALGGDMSAPTAKKPADNKPAPS